MLKKSEKARELFKTGLNCSQSVVAAFADVLGLSEQTAARLSAGLGGGVGRQREVCGAVSGAAMVLGFVLAERTERTKNAPMKRYANFPMSSKGATAL